jgi:hypothetical protein
MERFYRSYLDKPISNTDKVLIRKDLNIFESSGLFWESQYRILHATWKEIRRARGAIIRSVLTDDELDTLDIPHRPTRYLNDEEIDRLTHLTTLAAITNGALFWTKDIQKRDKLRLRTLHSTTLQRMACYTAHIHTSEDYSRYNSLNILNTFAEPTSKYFISGIPASDNLGIHYFCKNKPHRYLDTISIASIKKRIQDEHSIVVLAAAASSGVLQAGVIAHYMTHMLNIPTTVDPIFFQKDTGDTQKPHTMNSTSPQQRVLVIPFDDQIAGTGFSSTMIFEAVHKKYKPESVLLSENWEQGMLTTSIIR